MSNDDLIADMHNQTARNRRTLPITRREQPRTSTDQFLTKRPYQILMILEPYFGVKSVRRLKCSVKSL